MRKQLNLFKNSSLSHGGSLRVGKRKIARPLVTKSPIHVVLKSSRARGAWSFHRNTSKVREAVESTAKRKNIRILLYQNVGNHLHLAIQGSQRKLIQDFFRIVTQRIAYLVTRTCRGSPVGKFWDSLIFTRVVRWGMDWMRLQIYFRKNYWEAAGVPRAEVDTFYRDLFS